MDCTIRLATAGDLFRIDEIYNYYVLHSTCTYQEQVDPPEVRLAWFAAHDASHPVTVAVADGKVIGWGSLSKFHPRSAYKYTVENSIYVDHTCHRKGVGRAIMEDLIDRAEKAGFHSIVALIDGGQSASLALHQKYGFELAGRLKEAGYKFDRWLDMVQMQRPLSVGKVGAR